MIYEDPERLDLIRWTGPDPEDLDAGGHLVHPVPSVRWPYGPPHRHQSCCLLHQGGRYCDCAASDASDGDWGMPQPGAHFESYGGGDP